MKSFVQDINAFYPEYLAAHSDRGNRVLHFIGTTLFFSLIIIGLVTGMWWMIPLGIFIGYLLPGIGHRFLQQNDSFRASRPVFCVLCAFRLYLRMLSFGIIR